MNMNFLEIAKTRYTTKSYDANKIITEIEIEKLKEILRLCPSSINSQPWKFIFISEKDIKQRLAKVSLHNRERVERASHLVIFTVIDDLERFEERIEKDLPKKDIETYNKLVKPKGETVIKAWLEKQLYISLGFFLSACPSYGIDSTPMEGIEHQDYDSILKLKGYKTLFAVAIGYRNNSDRNQPSVNSKQRLELENVTESI